ncbi:MAG: hypothetical protein GYB68_12410 [Chloroflexi bacterium]|nr:hypothetical protein [Chloroflexota bacterium]
MTVPPPFSTGPGKATLNTRFHIDESWFDEAAQRNLQSYMDQLAEEYEVDLTVAQDPERLRDWIDPYTGRISRVDGVMYEFLEEIAAHPDFITERTSLIEAVFRALLTAANYPMTAIELADRIGRPAEMILRTLSGRQVYKGIRVYKAPEDA